MNEVVLNSPLALGAMVASLILIGAMVGTVGGLFGIGGGIIMVPALSGLLEWLGARHETAMHVAVATSLATILPISFASLRAHIKHGAFDFTIVKRWGPALIFGALAGGLLAAHMPGRFLRIVFGVFVLLVTWRFIHPPPEHKPHATPSSLIQRMLAFLIGGTAALLGIGGGVLGVTALGFCGLPLKRAIGTASSFGFMAALPGVTVYLASQAPGGIPYGTIGLVHPLALLLLTPGAMYCAPIGARLTHRLPVKKLRAWFAIFLIILGGKMLWSGLWP